VKVRLIPHAVLVAVAAAFTPSIAFAEEPQPAGSATVPQPTPPPSPVPAPSPEEVQHRRMGVTIDSTKPATVIERRISAHETDGSYLFVPYHSSETAWEQVCVTQCQVDLDRFSSYRVGKLNGVQESRSFTLPQQASHLMIKIEPGSAIGHRIGASLTGVGLGAFIVGGGLIAAQKIFSDEQDARTAGFITGGAGLVLMALGIPVAILSSTKVLGNDGRIALTARGLVF
jgi:hypothetical protein